MNKKIWIVVANSTRARMFNTDLPGGTLEELPELTHLAGKSKPGDLLADRPGRDSNRNQSASNTLGHEKDVKEHEALSFAREISDKLEQAHHQHQIRRLYLVTSPRMLGLLRKQLSDEVRSVISEERDLNLVKEDLATIRSHLPKQL